MIGGVMSSIVLKENKYGQKIWLNENNHVGQAIIQKGVYDEHAIYYIEKILTYLQEPVCLDIGANIGNHALVMSRFSKMVYCFDPESENIDFLTKNKQANHLHNMQVLGVGLSDENASLTFYKNGRGGCSTFSPDLKGEGYTEEMLTCRIGDEVIEEQAINHIDFIKIDIEGFEARALYGLKNSIQKSRPILMMEWNNNTTREQFKKYDLFNIVFKNYCVLAVLNNHHRNYWGQRFVAKVARFFYRKIIKKRRILCQFNAENSYVNVILYPAEKSWVADIK